MWYNNNRLDGKEVDMKKMLRCCLMLGMILFLTGCGEVKLSCTLEGGDYGDSSVYTFTFKDKEATRPESVDMVIYHYNVKDVDVEALQIEECSNVGYECNVSETREGYKVEKSYDIYETDVTDYGSYDETMEMLKKSGWSCE